MAIRYTLYDLSKRIDSITVSGITVSGTGGITVVQIGGTWYVDGSTMSGLVTVLSGTEGIITNLVDGIWYVEIQIVDGGSLS